MTRSSAEIMVRMGEVAVQQGSGTFEALGLGSCVAVILHDSQVPVGSLGHVSLPAASLSRDRSKPARTADTAVPLLVEQMLKHGAALKRTEALLVGGATMFSDLLPSGAVHIGDRNVAACQTALRHAGITIRAEAVGGQTGRSVWFDVAAGTATVRATGREPVVI